MRGGKVVNVISEVSGLYRQLPTLWGEYAIWDFRRA